MRRSNQAIDTGNHHHLLPCRRHNAGVLERSVYESFLESVNQGSSCTDVRHRLSLGAQHSIAREFGPPSLLCFCQSHSSTFTRSLCWHLCNTVDRALHP